MEKSAGEVIEKLTRHGLPNEPILMISDYRLRAGQTGVGAIRAVREATGCSWPSAIWTAETSRAPLKELAAEGLITLRKPVKDKDLLDFLLPHKQP